ncbi:MAG: putative membrane protein [uncultured archaeon A07HB70]|nr:MAG: putative membrane protein [uncultured archaeon A07HB70]
MNTVVWAIVAVVGAVTFAFRHSFVYLFDQVDGVPPRLRAPLRYVPAAVLAAFVAPALLGPVTGPGPLVTARTAAGAVAVVVAWRTENAAATLAVGMVVLWLFRLG